MATHGDDRVWSYELVVELHTWPLRGPTFACDVHLVANLEIRLSTMFVGLFCLSILSGSEVLSSPFHSFMSPAGKGLCVFPGERLSRGGCFPCAFIPVEVKSRLVAEFKLIWSVTGGGMREDSLSEIDTRKEV